MIVLWKYLDSEKLLDCRRLVAYGEPVQGLPDPKGMGESAIPAVRVLRERVAEKGANVLVAYWHGQRDAFNRPQREMYVLGTGYFCESTDSRRLAKDSDRVPASAL